MIEKDVMAHIAQADEIWHAGDWGSKDVVNQLEQTRKPIKAVYGNIDGHDVRVCYPKELYFKAEELNVFMTHIAGHPDRYANGIAPILKRHQPDIIVCGHSHILRVIRDKKHEVLYLNPGACGRSGFHQFRTLLGFTIDKKEIRDMRAIDLGARGF